MGSSSKQNKSSPGSLFALGLVAVGSLLAIGGGVFLFHYYPSDCSINSNVVLCSPRQMLLFVSIITLLASGVPMMIYGLVMLFCSSETTSHKAKDFKKSQDKMTTKATKPAKSQKISTTYVITEETLGVVKQTQPHTVFYNPPPLYFDQNLVLATQLPLEEGPMETTLRVSDC